MTGENIQIVHGRRLAHAAIGASANELLHLRYRYSAKATKTILKPYI